MARQLPTVYEVAQHAGVSTATVSRVLAGNDRVAPARKEKVLAAVKELGYVPSGAARDLAARRTDVLGLCFPDLAGDEETGTDDSVDSMFWYDEVIRGMERAARRRGYAVLIAASHASDDVDLVANVAGRCDGMVVLARTVPVPVLERIAARIPAVMLAGPRDPRETSGAIDHLVVSNAQGARELTGHLIRFHSHRSLGFIGGPDSPDSAARFEGYRSALAEAGVPVPDAPLAMGDFSTAGGRRAVRAILADGRLPKSLVCVNDQTALGVMQELAAAGLSIPNDVAVTGFDGIQVGRHVRPALTTAVQPMKLLGETAVRLLEERIAEPGKPAEAIELPVRVELRESCGCSVSGD
ncbi:LacI family DNA-binding transcriptional regulator [Streptomyces mirabilis]|uniref:LacI family DNA-binding transcriptional regulator n=1 Tax=Streptomyces mirabilis TaxID=68239 RepID=UPI0036B2AEDE